MSLKSRKSQSGKQDSISYAQIAKAAGVSPGLISAFFSGNHYSAERKSGIGISSEKRKKIIKTCHSLHYVPDTPYAFYRLYPEKADVGVLLNSDVGAGFSNPYHSLLFEGMAERAREVDVELSNLFFDGSYDYLIRPEAIPNAILNGSVNKLAITGRPNCSLVYRLLKMDVSLVLVGQAIPMDGVVSVVPDFFEASRLAIHTLYEFGHRSIAIAAHTSYAKPDAYNGRLLRQGADHALRELGLSPREHCQLDVRTDYGVDDLKAQLQKMPATPTAIYCFDDAIARNISHVASQSGFSVPGDISILGCNDDRINRDIRPGFSTIHLPSVQIGRRAFDELTRVAAEGRPTRPETIMLPVHYEDRGTVRAISA